MLSSITPPTIPLPSRHLLEECAGATVNKLKCFVGDVPVILVLSVHVAQRGVRKQPCHMTHSLVTPQCNPFFLNNNFSPQVELINPKGSLINIEVVLINTEVVLIRRKT